LLPVEVTSVELTNEGLRFDRCFTLIYPTDGPPDSVAKHLTIKNNFKLCLFQPSIDETWTKLTITHNGSAPPSAVVVPLTPSPVGLLNANTYTVSIFGTAAPGVDMGDEPANFFSKHLNERVRLVFIGGSGCREIPGAAYVPKQLNALSIAVREGLQPQRIRFADAAPLLITTTASEQDLRARLPQRFQDEDIILRLRPNIHIDVKGLLSAYDEDYWSSLLVQSRPERSQEVTIKCIFRTVRCLSLNADPETGTMITRERQLYGLLAPHRRVNERFPRETPEYSSQNFEVVDECAIDRPVFGQYGFGGPSGTILRRGDKIVVTERISE
jgi:uncharacterized protein